MGKKKTLTPDEEKKKKLNKLKKFYDAANESLQLEGKSVNEQVAILVNKCDELMSDICANSDQIKIDDFDKAKEITLPYQNHQF